jgi:CRP/FNR family transcriptional regulator, anaerobic regulatory protein
MVACATCSVRHRSLCGALSPDQLFRLNGIARHRHFVAGDVILREGETPDYFANVVSGAVKLSRTTVEGQHQILGLQFASDFLGRPFRSVFGYDAHAITAVHLCTFPRQPFEGLLREYPSFERRLFEQTLDELDAARDWAAVLTRTAARERLCLFLLSILQRFEASGCGHTITPTGAILELPVSRAEIASYLGLTIETISRQFTQLKVDGIISLPSPRELVVLDLHALKAAAGA